MPLKTMGLATGATVTTTGGTALTFAADGLSVANGVHVIAPADVYNVRRQVTFKFRSPTVDAKSGQWSKGKKTATFVQPVVLASGEIVFNTLRVELETHPETSDATCTDYLKIGAQLLTDSDTANFWAYGALD